ncbi:MAG: glutamate-1-semialdehyde 2,1-aminomutase [Halieaceae bacterium]|jgi:glutamate-1-semialdehyde 2,1-aminomutase
MSNLNEMSQDSSRDKRIDELRRNVFADYRAKTPLSAAMFERARQSLSGGVSGNLRYIDPYPIYMTHGQGASTFDVDCNEYLDCFGGNGPLLLGHNHPAVVESIRRHTHAGSLPFNPDFMVECAELVQEIVPCAERIRFLNTGTEAVMMAVRFARAFTGKSKILKFQGHYHGQHDQVLFALGPNTDFFSAGVPRSAIADTVVLAYNDINAVEKTLAENADIAAVILDPAMHAGGLWGSQKEFLQALREATNKHGVLLIFDEVITGFRMAPGGAQAHFGVTPDLTTLAKALAAGEKLSVVCGREDVMQVVDPTADASVPRVFQSGTVNDGTVALAAAIAALKTYKSMDQQGQYQRLADLGTRLSTGIKAAFLQRGIGCHINQIGSMLQIFVSEEPPSFENYHALDMTVLSLFFQSLINEGVFLTVPSSDHIYLSFAHTAADIELILGKVDTVFNRYGFAEAF